MKFNHTIDRSKRAIAFAVASVAKSVASSQISAHAIRRPCSRNGSNRRLRRRSTSAIAGRASGVPQCSTVRCSGEIAPDRSDHTSVARRPLALAGPPWRYHISQVVSATHSGRIRRSWRIGMAVS